MSKHNPAPAEITVDLDVLEKSAAELLASAEVMTKGGFNMATGEHVDERGTVPGTFASDSDAGKIEQLMIGRATQALLDMGIKKPTKEQVGKMVGHMKGDDEDEDEDGDGEDAAAYAKSEADALEMFQKLFKSNSTLAKSEADPALTEVITVTSKALAGINAANVQFAKSQRSFNIKLAKGVQAMGREIRALRSSNAAMAEKLGVVERAPVAPPAGVRVPETVAKGGSAAQPGAQPDALSKSQVCSVMSYMAIVKGERHMGGQDLLTKSALFQGGSPVTQDMYNLAVTWLNANPSERVSALTYNLPAQ